MNVTTQQEGKKLTIFVEGRLGTTTAPILEKTVRDHISGVEELCFDFAKVEYMASAGLRVLLSAAKIMKKQGSMKVIHVTPEVMTVFKFTGIANILDTEAV